MKKDVYNTLSIDGGGIRGIVPNQVIVKMEKYAWEYAGPKGKNYKIPTYNGLIDNEVIAMKELFNMTAGTSTGSIIAAGLSYPNDPDVAYWDNGVPSYRTNATEG